MSVPAVGRLRRLAEELEESGLVLPPDADLSAMLIEEIDHALRPPIHERRVPSSGMILEPRSDPSTWEADTELQITYKPLHTQTLQAARLFADGLSSWLLRCADGRTEWMVFDRPAGSERDLVVLAGVLDAAIVQRHPAGSVRVAGDFGVLRWEGFTWHHEPPLDIRKAIHLGPLRHALSQVDGAAVFDAEGVLRHLGVRLVPSAAAEESVEAFGGTRHISGRRYSYDDPLATVIVVSEDGPVTVLRNGAVLGRSHKPE